MPSIDWTWLLVGLALGLWGVPIVLGLLNGRRAQKATAAA